MAYQYTYGVPVAGLDPSQLHAEIDATSLNSYGFLGVIFDGVNLNFLFNTEVSAPDQITLQNIVASFVPDGGAPPCGEKFADVHILKTVVSTIYTTCGSFYFPGTASGTSMDKIQLLSYLTAGTSYIVRVMDFNNNKVIIPEQTFTNTTKQYNDLGAVQNLPRQPSLIEIQIKATTSSTVYADNAIVF